MHQLFHYLRHRRTHAAIIQMKARVVEGVNEALEEYNSAVDDDDIRGDPTNGDTWISCPICAEYGNEAELKVQHHGDCTKVKPWIHSFVRHLNREHT